MTDEAFAQAAREWSDTVYRVAYHALNSREDAEDVMQTVLLKLYECKKEFESEEHLKHWLLRVAVNESRKVRGCRPSRGASAGDGSGGEIPGGRLPLLLRRAVRGGNGRCDAG